MNIEEQNFYNKKILPTMKKIPIEVVSTQLWEKIAVNLAEPKTKLIINRKTFLAELFNFFNLKVFVVSAVSAVLLMVFSFNYYQNIQAARYLNMQLANISSADYFYADNYYYQQLY